MLLSILSTTYYLDDDPTPQTYTITVNGGTANPTTAAAGALISITAGTAPSGKTFDKWTTSDGVSFANANSATTTFTMPSKAVTVTATYKDISIATYTVTFDSKGGSAVSSLIGIISGSKINKPFDPTRSGYKFIAWCKDSLCTQPWNFSTDTVAGNITLYARWEALSSPAEKLVTKITILGNPASLTMGKTVTLKATVTPSDATNKTVKWSSSNTSIATVNSVGTVTPQKAGTVKITATATDGSKVSQSVTITVKNNPVTKITISGNPANLTVSKTATLKVSVSPSDATIKTLKWTTSDKSIATVSSAGTVTAKNPGEVTITATATDGSKVYKSVTITVHSYVIMKIGKATAIMNGKKTTIDSSGTKPIKIGGRTMVPVRFVAEKMGGKVKYVSDSQPIVMTYGKTTVKLTLNSKKLTITTNGKTKQVTMDVAAQKVKGKTYIPLRAISQALGFAVYYESGSEYIIVNTPAMDTALRKERLAEAKKIIK